MEANVFSPFIAPQMYQAQDSITDATKDGGVNLAVWQGLKL